MKENVNKNNYLSFEKLLVENDINKITAFLNNLNISDVVDIIIEYPEHSTYIIQHMFIHRSVNVFKVLELNIQKEIINNLPAGKTAELLNELAPDDRTAFLEELPKAVIRELVKLLNNEERKITLSMLGYPEDSVGRLMTPDYVYVYSDNTITEAFEIVRKYAKNSETIDIIYVIDEKGGLVDDIRIKDLILADLNKIVSDISDGRFIALNAHDDQDMARQVFKKNNRVALPVIDDNKILLGIVTIDDILWVADEEFSEDIQKIGGTESFNESYLDIPLFKLIRKRVSWLVILFLGELLTANVMVSVENELAKAIVLSLFIPLILSSGGNSGSQASTLIIQAMTIGDIKIKNWFFILKREILSGLILGSILGFIGFCRVLVWHYFINAALIGPHYQSIALVVGFSLIGIVLFGTIVGSMLPIILKKLGADPAVSSAPFVATIVDVSGLIIYFSVANVFLTGKLL